MSENGQMQACSFIGICIFLLLIFLSGIGVYGVGYTIGHWYGYIIGFLYIVCNWSILIIPSIYIERWVKKNDFGSGATGNYIVSMVLILLLVNMVIFSYVINLN